MDAEQLAREEQQVKIDKGITELIDNLNGRLVLVQGNIETMRKVMVKSAEIMDTHNKVVTEQGQAILAMGGALDTLRDTIGMLGKRIAVLESALSIKAQ